MLQKKSYTKDNIHIAYYQRGEGKTLIFLHGAGIRALTYKKSLLTLSEKFKVIAPDLPGFGDSDIPPLNWGFTNYAEYLDHFLNSIGVNEYILVAHSLAGRIAIELAARTNKITHLVLIDPSPQGEYYVKNTHQLSKLILITSVEILREWDLAYAKVALDNLYNIKRNKLAYLKFKDMIYAALKKSSNSLENITIPTLILWGNRDRVIPIENSYALQKKIKNSQVKIVNGNHAWCMTKPDLLLSELLSFTSSQAST